jgi:hypothetical protein
LPGNQYKNLVKGPKRGVKGRFPVLKSKLHLSHEC